MQLAEKFGRPIFTFVDTPGAYPGLGAEERGQAEAIARNLREMARLQVPIITTITGEGGSGGALAIAVGDRVLMMENAIYSVISPEGCASIMWRDATKKELAARGHAHHRRRPEAARLHRRHRSRARRRRPHRPRPRRGTARLLAAAALGRAEAADRRPAVCIPATTSSASWRSSSPRRIAAAAQTPDAARSCAMRHVLRAEDAEIGRVFLICIVFQARASSATAAV